MGTRNINALHNDINEENINNINNIINIDEAEGNQENLIPFAEQNHIVQDRTISKKILAARLPSNLDKRTLSLELDYLSPDKCYLKFIYDSLFDLDIYINFNVTERAEFSAENINHKLAYSPSANFARKGFYIHGLEAGEKKEFFDKNTIFDIRDYFEDKLEIQNSYDVCIEFVPLFPPGSPETADNNEIIFVTLCNFERHQDDNNYIIKCIKQRLRTHKIWIDLYDIFDSALEGGLCLICCSERRNTIFLPCKHACCCNKCGSEIKYRFKPCPICKTPIDDLLIVNSDEKKIKIENEESEYLDTSDNLESNGNDSNLIINTGNSNLINDSNNMSENINEDDSLIPVSNDKKNINSENKFDNKNKNIIEINTKDNDEVNFNNENNIDNINKLENDYVKIEDKDDKGE